MKNWIRKLNESARDNENAFREWLRDELAKEEEPSQPSSAAEAPSEAQARSDGMSGEASSDAPVAPSRDDRSVDDKAPSEEYVVHAAAADALLRRVLARMRDAPEMLSTKHDAGASLAEQIRKHLQSVPAFDEVEVEEPPETDPNAAAPEGASLDTSPLAPTEEEDERTSALAAHFVAWCTRLGPMLSRYYMFERFLQQQTKDDAWRVALVYRDTRAASLQLTSNAPHASEAYWLVEMGDRQWILPQPQSAESFCVTKPVFEHVRAVAPESVSVVFPARVEATDEAYRVRATGSLQ
jgi:hypothetical protein